MAKKRNVETLTSDENELESLFSDVTSIGKHQVVVPSNLSIINKILGGGFKTGTLNILTGASHSGKSSMAGSLMANMFKTYEDAYGVYADIEQGTDKDRLISLGVPGDNKRFIHYSLSVTLESLQKQIDGVCAIKEKYKTQDVPMLMVIDSLDAALSEKEEEADNPDRVIGTRAKYIKFLIRKNLNRLLRYNICLMFVCHITENVNMNGPYAPYSPKLETLGNMVVGGGKSVEFFPHIFLIMRQRKSKSNTEFLVNNCKLSESSYIVEATTAKCKNVPNGIMAKIVFDPGLGFLELPTRIYNMNDDKVFTGTTKKALPNDPDNKFWMKDIVEKYETESGFKEKFDECWEKYLELKYGNSITSQERISTMGIDSSSELTSDSEIAENIENDNDTRKIDFSDEDENLDEENSIDRGDSDDNG